MRLPNYIENLDEWKSEFSFSTDIKIRFSETDMFGHVNNVSQFIYFGDKLKVYVKVATAGTSSIDIHYLGVNEKEEICLTGRGALVNVNPATKKAAPLSEELKKKMLESKSS